MVKINSISETWNWTNKDSDLPGYIFKIKIQASLIPLKCTWNIFVPKAKQESTASHCTQFGNNINKNENMNREWQKTKGVFNLNADLKK